MKKILSVILIMSMLVLPQVSAEQAEQKDNDYNSAAGALYELGIMKGDEAGNLNKDKLLTRAEFAALVTRVINRGTGSNIKNFNDVSENHWAVADINYMAGIGAVEGYENGCFGPDDTVTLSQAVKIILSVLGLSEKGFSYPDDYLICASENKLTVGLNVRHDAALSRENAALLIINALYTPDKDGGKLIDRTGSKTYFVSSEGDDGADGSFRNPWKTLGRAVSEAGGNSIIYLKDGEYSADGVVIGKGGESEEKPLIIRTAPGSKAVVTTGFTIDEGADYVSLRGITFKAGAEEMLLCKGEGFSLKNSDVQSLTVKLENAENAEIYGNTFSDGASAVVIAASGNAEIEKNIFRNQLSVSITATESSKTKIRGNYFYVNGQEAEAAISLSGNDSAVWNNIFYSEDGTTAAAVSLESAVNVHFYNNIVEGTNGGLRFKGESKSVVSKNNIFSQCSDLAYDFIKEPSGFESDYNCFYTSYPEVKEKNSTFSEPYFVSRGTDWRLMPDSPVVLYGTSVKDEIICSDGSVMKLDMSDMDNKPRGEKWYPGVYSEIMADSYSSQEEASGVSETIIWKQDFAKNADGMLTAGGDWKVSGGKYLQESPASARTTSVYKLGEDWADYIYSADVESSNVEGNASGIIFRSDLAMTNMYTFRFLSNNTLEFAKWQNGSFASIDKWDYEFNTDKLYNLKVKAEGNIFTFYVNGVEVREVQDNSFHSGTVGLYSFREKNQYDNLKVIQVY